MGEESGSEAKYPSENKYYIKGAVTTLTECSASYGNATFIIGEPDYPFTGFRLKLGAEKEKIPTDDYVQVGDVVTMYSDLLNFHGTMETNDGYIDDILWPAPTTVTVKAAGDATEVVVGGKLQMSYELTPAHSGGAVSYAVTCDPAGCATISESGELVGVAAGTATVKVTVGGVEGTKAITVREPSARLIDEISFNAASYDVNLETGSTVQLAWTVTFKPGGRPEKAAELEKALAGFTFAKVGKTNGSGILSVKGTQEDFSIPLETLIESYKTTLAGV